MTPNPSRRDLLATAGAAAVGGLAGCVSLSGGSRAYRLDSRTMDAERPYFLLADPTSQRAKLGVDYPDEYKREAYDELVETGSVTTVEFPLVSWASYGEEDREQPRFLVKEGTYYRAHIENYEWIERDLIEFYLDLVDEEPPADADVVSPPVEGLSETDRRIMEVAKRAGGVGNTEFEYDVGEKQPGTRGAVYHRFLSEAESDLVPEAPFDYLATEYETFRPRSERAPIPLERWTFSAEPVAGSEADLKTHIEETVLDADFDSLSLNDGERRVLEAATRTAAENPGFYEEDDPMSEGLESVLADLNVADDLKPYDQYSEYTNYSLLYGVYDGEWRSFDLTVRP
jgi:hypothetical protein